MGSRISSNRKIKGVTQEELAHYLGVSKPAVSKWESGQSYPDITLLPLLAAYFSISVDELIGYVPQMTKEDIRKLYRRLSDDFASKPFEQVYEECMEYVKKYYSCWLLQVQMGLLLINHSAASGNTERGLAVIHRAKELFERVSKEADDVNLAKQSKQMQAYCYLCLQQPIDAIDLLENLKDNFMPTESLLVKAYQMKGDKEKALQYLQGFTFVSLSNMINSIPDYFAVYSDDPEKMLYYYEKFNDLIKVFEFQKLNPAMLIILYITAAQVFMTQGNKEKALDALEEYVHISKEAVKSNFKLNKNQFFDVLEQFCIDMDIDTTVPRNSSLIINDIKNLILHNPVFAELENEERFKHIKHQIETE